MKTLLLFILVSIFANANNYTTKLYKKLLKPLFYDKVPIIVFVDNEIKETIKQCRTFKIQNSCDKSVDILLGSNFSNLPRSCKDKPLFATTYKAYTQNKNAFGAFYWRKGRPQIHFNKNVLKKLDLQLPVHLQRFIDE